MHNASTALCNQHPRNPHHHQQHPPPRGGGEQGQIRAPVSRLNPPPCPCSLTTPTPPSPGISTRGTPPHQPVPAASFLPTRGTRCARLLISPPAPAEPAPPTRAGCHLILLRTLQSPHNTSSPLHTRSPSYPAGRLFSRPPSAPAGENRAPPLLQLSRSLLLPPSTARHPRNPHPRGTHTHHIQPCHPTQHWNPPRNVHTSSHLPLLFSYPPGKPKTHLLFLLPAPPARPNANRRPRNPHHQPAPDASFLPTRGTAAPCPRRARLLISPRRSLTYTLQRPSSALHSPSYPGVNQKLTHPRNPCRLHPLHLRALTFTLHHTPQHQGRAPERNVVSSSHPPSNTPPPAEPAPPTRAGCLLSLLPPGRLPHPYPPYRG